MLVTCVDCDVEYDDTYRRTSCPHEAFEMHTTVLTRGGVGCAHTVEELREALRTAPPNIDCPVFVARERLRAEVAT